MKAGLTEIVCIVDRSGSMGSTKHDAVGGFNEMLAKQLKVPGEARLTLALFNTEVSRLYDGTPLKDVKPLEVGKDYVPEGMTALLDAVAETIDGVGKRLETTPDDQRAEKVIVVIITDGQENSSTRFKLADVAARIRTQRETYKWEFLFLGANVDSFAEAGRLNIPKGQAMNFTSDAKGTRLAYCTAASVLTSYRTGGTAKIQ